VLCCMFDAELCFQPQLMTHTEHDNTGTRANRVDLLALSVSFTGRYIQGNDCNQKCG
jgi:hypothetical protein